MRPHRKLLSFLVCACLTALSSSGVPARAPSSRPPATPASETTMTDVPHLQASANLAQLMQAIIFPNSNVIFFAQDKNPADVKHAEKASLSTDPLAGTFGGWAAVENSSLALAEAANLLTIPGRVCSNGRTVPVNDTDWLKFVQGLRAAGLTSYQAAQSKSNDQMLEAADAVMTACSNCHNRYRDKPGGLAGRCR